MFAMATVYSQSEKINQNDDAGMKHGRWMVYLDKKWNEIADTNLAIYKKYTVYFHGKNLYPMGSRGSWQLSEHANSKLLDGRYEWKDKAGTVRCVDVFSAGRYLSCKIYSSTGVINQYFDYERKYKGMQDTYCISEFDKDGKLKKFFINRDGEQGWNFYQASEDDLK